MKDTTLAAITKHGRLIGYTYTTLRGGLVDIGTRTESGVLLYRTTARLTRNKKQLQRVDTSSMPYYDVR